MERELGEEWKLRGAAGLGKGVKNCKYRIGFIPVFQTLEPAV